jgi:hypothetical protein
MALSRLRSATRFYNQAFSFSSSLSFLASVTVMPPYCFR